MFLLLGVLIYCLSVEILLLGDDFGLGIDLCMFMVMGVLREV